MRKIAQRALATVRSAYPELAAVFHRRAEETGYRSIGAYFFWLAVYDVMVRAPHKVTPTIAAMLPEQQEKYFRALVEEYDRGASLKGYFELQVQRAAQEEYWRACAKVRDLEGENRELRQALARAGVDYQP